MTTAGPNICGLGFNIDDGGNVAWSNPGRITTADDSYSTCAISYGYKKSQLLIANNFGFSIPAGATITNVSFTYRRDLTTATCTENTIQMTDAYTSLTGNNKASGYWDGTPTESTRSGDSTYWGVTLTPTLMNDAGFGLMIKVEYNGYSTTARVDWVSCTVTYTVGGVGLIGDGLVVSESCISHGLVMQ